jgi:hypothetical protein
MLLPLLAEEGPFATVLDTILRRGQMPQADFARHQRAMLEPRGDRWDYLDHALSRHRLKELRRTGRRLADRGALLFTATAEPAGVAEALDDFLALEAGGWKGRAGTAAAHDDAVQGFIETALYALATERKVAINRLLLDGRPIAATITLRSGDTAWYWKTAYDERLARYAPGMLLTAALTEELAEDSAIVRTDSAAAPDNFVLDQIWRERLTLSDRLIATRPTAPFDRARRLEKLRGTVLTAAKSIRARLHG